MARLFLFAAFICMLMAAPAAAQIPDASQGAGSLGSARADRNSRSLGAPEDEMLARNAVKAAEKDRQENLERASEGAHLGTELRDVYKQNKTLARADFKKLERLEKITRGIRKQAGGSDDEADTNKWPTQLDLALARLAELTESLWKKVEKTPRQVVSASVIEESNEVLDLIKFIRDQTR